MERAITFIWGWYQGVDYFSFSYNELGVTQSLHGNVYKVVNYEGQVTDVIQQYINSGVETPYKEL